MAVGSALENLAGNGKSMSIIYLLYFRRRSYILITWVHLYLHGKLQRPCMSFLFLFPWIAMAVQKDLEYLRKRFMFQGVTERELHDIRVEFSRQNLQLELCLLWHNARSLGLNLKRNYRKTMTSIQDELSSGRIVKEERLDMYLGKLGDIRWLNLFFMLNVWTCPLVACRNDVGYCSNEAFKHLKASFEQYPTFFMCQSAYYFIGWLQGSGRFVSRCT